MKLIKLLYMLDREALLRWGAPVTYDRYVSMNRGPVLSSVLNRINSTVDPDHCSYWHTHISECRQYRVRLLADPGLNELSAVEVALAEEIFRQYGHVNRWRLVDLTHRLPEWEYPDGSAIPITYRSILEQGDYSAGEIDLIEEELSALALADELFTVEG